MQRANAIDEVRQDLVYALRTWGSYPDGVAFAVLLMNAAAPFIDISSHVHPSSRIRAEVPARRGGRLPASAVASGTTWAVRTPLRRVSVTFEAK
mgnify:CR=1 FL=1